jgi:hypothetical protein
MALGSTESLTEMSTRNLLGGKGPPARKADNLTAICESVIWKMREPRRHTTLWASTAYYKDSFTFFFLTSSYSKIEILCGRNGNAGFLALPSNENVY